MTIRRYLRRKADAAAQAGDDALAAGFETKRQHAPGVPLPVNLLHRDALITGRYTTLQDLQGATLDELIALPKIGRATAERILQQVADALTARGETATPLPEDFPSRATLALAGYTTLESLAGHGTKELARIDGLTDADIAEVHVALVANESSASTNSDPSPDANLAGATQTEAPAPTDALVPSENAAVTDDSATQTDATADTPSPSGDTAGA